MSLAVLESRPAPDLAAPVRRLRPTCTLGTSGVVGGMLQIVGEELAEAVDLRAGERVLDVAAGHGNATLAAARRFAHVTSVDAAPALLERGRERARAEQLTAQFRQAELEDLPFAPGSFDLVLSAFGAMFSPDPQRSAQQMLRVLRRGGRIGLANWTPEGFVGRLLEVVAAHVPPPRGLPSPALWGTEMHLAGLFGAGAAQVRNLRRHAHFRCLSPAHGLQVLRDADGPLRRAFASLEGRAAQALEREVLALLRQMNVAGPASLVVPAEYLEVVFVKR